MTNKRSNGERACQNRSCRNLKMDKEKSTGRIAGAVATVIALDRANLKRRVRPIAYITNTESSRFFLIFQSRNEKKFHIAIQKNEKKFLKPLDF